MTVTDTQQSNATSTPVRTLRLAERVAIAILERIGMHLWGFRPRLMRTIVTLRGPAASLRWFVSNMPRYERTLADWGLIRTHLACAAISSENGCPYCTFGHAFALELAILREHDRLLPIDENEIAALHALGRDRRRLALREALRATGLEDETVVLERVWAVYDGAAAATDEARRIGHLVEMFAFLNACGIEGCAAPDEAHDPINKDTALKQRYRARRSSSG